jgi:hypothetical protein
MRPDVVGQVSMQGFAALDPTCKPDDLTEADFKSVLDALIAPP